MRMMTGFCAERQLCVGNIYFEYKSLHKYTRVARGQGLVELMSVIDLVLVKKDMLRYVEDVRAIRGMGLDLSDHHTLFCKVMLVGARERW